MPWTRPGRRRAGGVLALLAVLTAAGAIPSSADPADVESAREHVATSTDAASAAERRLATIAEEFELAVEAYNEARVRHDEARTRLVDAVERVDAVQQRVERRQSTADGYARALYQGGAAYELEALLGATDLSDIRIRAAYLRSAAEAKLRLVERLRRDRGRELSQLADVADLRTAAADAERRMDDERRRAEALLAAQEDEVARLREVVAAARDDYDDAVEAEQARLERVRADRERRAREAAERERQERVRRERARMLEEQAAHESRARANASRTSEDAVPPPAAGPAAAGASVAVDAALSQLGKPYVWAAEGPDSYDCSGLTLWAWAHAGVSLPHSSRMQYAVTERVAVSDLQPGDLLFFGSPIHHVAMYVGDGVVVEAPYTGASVRLNTTAISRSDLVGAGRPG